MTSQNPFAKATQAEPTYAMRREKSKNRFAAKCVGNSKMID